MDMTDGNLQIKTLLLYIRVGLQVLSARLVLLVALALTFVLFCWAMYLPDYPRIAAATIFAVLVFLPATRIDAKMTKDRAVITPEAGNG
jgi:hypothetical protein